MLFYSGGLTNFPYQLSVEVSLVTMPPKRIIKSFFTATSKRSCQHIENETSANEGEVGGGGLIKMLGWVGLIKMEHLILFSAPLLFISLHHHCCVC